MSQNTQSTMTTTNSGSVAPPFTIISQKGGQTIGVSSSQMIG